MADKYKRNDRVVLRKCGEFYFLIDPCLSYNSEDEDILQINDFGVLIWESIKTPRQFEEVVRDVLNNISDEKTESLLGMINDDVDSFLNELIKIDFVGMVKNESC